MQVDGAEVPPGVKLMDFEDFETHRNLIFQDAKDTIQKAFPKEHNGVRMELTDVDYVDPEDYSIQEQKKALHEDKFIGRRLRGKVTLRDVNTGEVLDSKKMTLMKVPWLTDRGTFIREGNEWGTINQQRLLPGAYSRRQANGDLETQFNVRPGTGGAFRIQFNPQSAQYKFSIAGSDLHLYSLLKDIGVSDDEMRRSWGDAVFETNAAAYDSRTLEKAYSKIVPEWERKKYPDRTREDKIVMIKNALNRSQMAAAVARKTLPNLFSRTKSAGWRDAHLFMQKSASMKLADLQDIATYINVHADKHIDVSLPKEQLVQAIKNTIATGMEDGSMQLGKVDYSDEGAQLVRQDKATRFIEQLKKNITKPSKFLDSL